MKKNVRTILLIELVWILIIALVAIGVMLPIKMNAADYPFYFDNCLFIAVFITYFRLIFFINSSFLTFHVGFKLAILALAVPFSFTLIDRFNNIETFLDNNGTEPFFGHLHDAQQIPLEVYLRNEVLIFGSGSIAVSIILPLFLVYSIWLHRNRGRHI